MRLAFSILTACGFAFLTGCGSGFAGDNVTETPDAVVLTTTTGQAQTFAVVPGGTSPLGIAAIAYKGSAITADIVPDVTYTWAARYVNPLTDPVSVATYTVGSAPNGFKSCPAVPTLTPPVPILVQFGTGVASTLYPSYRSLGPTETTNEVFIGSVPSVPTPYCLRVEATSTNGHVDGGATVIVSQSP